jgi:hypothetical protein
MPDDWAWLGPVISQSYTRNSDAYHAEARNVFYWLAERAAFLRINVGVTPYYDEFMDANEAVLNHALEAVAEAATGESVGASARLWGEKADTDGIFECKHAFRMRPFAASAANEPVRVAVNGAPIEVGITKASTTLLHLEMAHSLVRWPYDDTHITVIALRPGMKTLRHAFWERVEAGR